MNHLKLIKQLNGKAHPKSMHIARDMIYKNNTIISMEKFWTTLRNRHAKATTSKAGIDKNKSILKTPIVKFTLSYNFTATGCVDIVKVTF
jgi:hypothetical protein